MSRTAKINLAIVAGAVLLWMVVRATTGGVHDALGPNGAAFETMVRNFTLKGGDKPTRLSPLLPALAWIPYAATHSVIASFTFVNAFAMAALVFGVCLLLDDRRVDIRWKAFAASAFALGIMFAKVAAFEPASPQLVALAAVVLAIAAADRQWTLAALAMNVAAVMALPLGLVAPAYALARAIRLRVAPVATALIAGPALLMWLFVQWWARGGVNGALSDFTPRAMFGSSSAWTTPAFVAFAIYFFVTAAGGLSLLACCRPSAWRAMARRSPETVVFIAGIALYAISAPDNAPLAFAFLAPIWILLCAEWSASLHLRRSWPWLTAGLLVTLATQRPFAQIDLAASVADWHPYDVYRAGDAVAGFRQGWILRMMFVAGVALAFGLVRGRHTTLPAAWSRASISVAPSRRWTALSYLFAAILSTITAYFLFGMPIQLSDSFGNLLDIQGVSAWQIFVKQVQNGSYLRPLLHVQLKVVYELARGNYFLWFRAVQAVQVLAALLMAVRLLRPTRVIDAVVLPCALAMLLGLHTFAGTITEAFPINTFLTLVLCCLAAATLAASRGGWWADLGAALVLALAILTLESGVLVWLILVVGYAVGYRGVSMRGVGLATFVLGGYFAARLLLLHGAPPGLDERATGFGFRVLQPSEVVARFGHNPVPFYIYNVLSALLTVLFAEPRGAVWQFIGGVSAGTVEPWTFVNVMTSTLTTGVLAWYIARRAPSWARFSIDEDDRLVLLFLAILPVNALLCAVYVKDVIMSPAGVFYALAAAVAIRDLVARTSRTMTSLVPVWTVVLLTVISAGWGWRLLGIDYSLRTKAADLRAEWGFEEDWEAANPGKVSTPDAIALKRALMDDAMWRRPAPPRLQVRWAERAFDKTQ